MTRDVRSFLRTVICLWAAAYAFAFSLEGCAPTTGRPPECDPRGGYEALLLTCNQLAETLVESIECENRVRRHCGRPERDGGFDAR